MVHHSGMISEAHSSEKKARRWDRWVTAVMVAVLFVPFPVARFESWPEGSVVSERIVMPWSSFRICFTAFPGGDAVVEKYGFDWKGELLPDNPPHLLVFSGGSFGPPLFKWQETPELPLTEMYFKGDLLRVETSWRPFLLWQARLLWGIYARH